MNSSVAITFAELDRVVEQIKQKEAEIKATKAMETELNKSLARLEAQAVQYLKDLKRTEYPSPHGLIKITNKWRVNLPVTDQDKRDLFEHLRERNIFDKYATVNSASLNSLYMADWEAAKRQGDGLTFSMPGIGARSLYEKLDYKAPKE